GRVDVLGHRVHLLREAAHLRVAFAPRPGFGESFVGDPAEQLRLGLLELAELEQVALLATVDLEGPASVHVVLGSTRILDHPVQRDELGGDDLPHDALLRLVWAGLVPCLVLPRRRTQPELIAARSIRSAASSVPRAARSRREVWARRSASSPSSSRRAI